MHASELLRDGVLAGRSVVVVGAGGGGFASAVAKASQALGAAVVATTALDEEGLAAVLRDAQGLHGVVFDGAGLSTAGGDRLRAGLDPAWVAMRAAVTERFIPDGDGGLIVLVAPRPDAFEHARAARTAFENLARTPSVEWSRFGIRAVTVTPGASTSDERVASLVAFLLSPAGDYYSGCRLSLGEAEDA